MAPLPAWTPLRVVLVVGGLAAILALAFLFPVSASHPNPDGPDQASAAPAGPGYTFLEVNRSGTPVRWNPCSDPIYYQLDVSAGPAWATTDIDRALADVSAATGLQFLPEGTTTRFPDPAIPLGSATAPAPVVIAWASSSQSRATCRSTSPTRRPPSPARSTPWGGAHPSWPETCRPVTASTWRAR